MEEKISKEKIEKLREYYRKMNNEINKMVKKEIEEGLNNEEKLKLYFMLGKEAGIAEIIEYVKGEKELKEIIIEFK